MRRYAPNKMPASVKRRYFELIREGHKGAAAACRVGVSISCGSLWFLDAGGVLITDPGPISPRFLTQDDRIAIADGLHAGQDAKVIAAGIGKSFQTVYLEISATANRTVATSRGFPQPGPATPETTEGSQDRGEP